LKNAVMTDRDVARQQQQEARNRAAGARESSAIAAGTLTTSAVVLAPFTFGLSLLLGAGAATAVGVGAALSNDNEQQANAYQSQYNALENSLNVLQSLELGLAVAIKAVSEHIRYWTRIHSQIRAAKMVPDRLLNNRGFAKLAMTKKLRHEWSEVEGKYRKYGETATSSRQALLLKM